MKYQKDTKCIHRYITHTQFFHLKKMASFSSSSSSSSQQQQYPNVTMTPSFTSPISLRHLQINKRLTHATRAHKYRKYKAAYNPIYARTARSSTSSLFPRKMTRLEKGKAYRREYRNLGYGKDLKEPPQPTSSDFTFDPEMTALPHILPRPVLKNRERIMAEREKEYGRMEKDAANLQSFQREADRTLTEDIVIGHGMTRPSHLDPQHVSQQIEETDDQGRHFEVPSLPRFEINNILKPLFAQQAYNLDQKMPAYKSQMNKYALEKINRPRVLRQDFQQLYREGKEDRQSKQRHQTLQKRKIIAARKRLIEEGWGDWIITKPQSERASSSSSSSSATPPSTPPLILPATNITPPDQIGPAIPNAPPALNRRAGPGRGRLFPTDRGRPPF